MNELSAKKRQQHIEKELRKNLKKVLDKLEKM